MKVTVTVNAPDWQGAANILRGIAAQVERGYVWGKDEGITGDSKFRVTGYRKAGKAKGDIK